MFLQGWVGKAQGTPPGHIAIKILGAGGQGVFVGEMTAGQQQAQVRLAAVGDFVNEVGGQGFGLLPCAVLQGHMHAQQGALRLLAGGGSGGDGLGRRPPDALLQALAQHIQGGHGPHVQPLQAAGDKGVGQGIGAAAVVQQGNEETVLLPVHPPEIPRPFAVYPGGVQIGGVAADDEHDPGGQQRGQHLGLVMGACDMGQHLVGKEDPVARIVQGVIEVAGVIEFAGAGVGIAAAGDALLVAQEDVPALLLGLGGQHIPLNLADVCAVRQVLLADVRLCAGAGQAIIVIFGEGGALQKMQHGALLLGVVIADIFHAVAAQCKAPECLGLVRMLPEDALIAARSVCELTGGALGMGAAEVSQALTFSPGTGMRRLAAGTGKYHLTGRKDEVPPTGAAGEEDIILHGVCSFVRNAVDTYILPWAGGFVQPFPGHRRPWEWEGCEKNIREGLTAAAVLWYDDKCEAMRLRKGVRQWRTMRQPGKPGKQPGRSAPCW